MAEGYLNATTVPREIRSDLLELTGGNVMELYRKLNPTCAMGTFYRAMSGDRVSETIASMIRSHHTFYAARVFEDEQVEDILHHATERAMFLRGGRKVNREDLERELLLYLQRKAIAAQG